MLFIVKCIHIYTGEYIIYSTYESFFKLPLLAVEGNAEPGFSYSSIIARLRLTVTYLVANDRQRLNWIFFNYYAISE